MLFLELSHFKPPLLHCTGNLRVTDRYKLTQALVVDPLYLQHSYSESAIDYRVRGNLILKVLRF